jgi:hypothetical protein
LTDTEIQPYVTRGAAFAGGGLEARIQAEHASVADPELREALVRDDLAEEGGMHEDDRQTCYSCRTWATPEHLDSPQHQALLGGTGDW